MENINPYFIGENGILTEGKKSVISFAESDEDREKIQKEIDANIEKNNADKKEYIILFAGFFGEEDILDYKSWEFVTGRQKAYDTIKETFLSEELKEAGVTFDAYASRIIVATNDSRLKINGISVYKFVSTMVREGKIEDNDGTFDIEEWAVDAEGKND